MPYASIHASLTKSDISHYSCSSLQFQLIDMMRQVNYDMLGQTGKCVLHNAIIGELCFTILIRKLRIYPILCQIKWIFWNIQKESVETIKLNLNTHMFFLILKWAFLTIA